MAHENLKPDFTCESCNRSFRWFMRGGTDRIIENPVAYSDAHVKKCAYCVGLYADGTRCNGGQK